MPRSGAGVYTPPSNSWYPAQLDTFILPDHWNDLLADLIAALTQSMASTGVTTATARIPFAQGIAVNVGTSAAPGVIFSGDLDTGLFQPAVNTLSISTGSVERWRIDATGHLVAQGSGRVMTSTGSPVTPSFTFAGDTDTGLYNPAANQLAMVTDGTQRWLVLATGSFNAGAGAGQFLPTDGTAAAPGTSFSGDTDTGIYRPGANRLGFSTAGTARWEIDASGDIVPAAAARGIYLGGSAAANFLNRYEEGSFTPTVAFATPGTSSFVYTVQSGVYRRIGNLVAFNLRLDFTPTIGTGSGDVTINGLPFTSGAERQAVTIGYFGRLTTFAASATMVHARTVPSSTSLIMAFSGPNVVPSNVMASNLTTGVAQLWTMSGAYYV